MITVDRTSWGRLRVTGGDRVRFLQGLTTINVEALAEGSHAWGAILNPKGRVLSVIDLAHAGDSFVVTCEAALAEPIASGPGAGALPQSDPAVERLRIRAGFLRYGVDVDVDHFPFETPLANFLDYGKGCYVGQEPVFRVHAQGNAARMLRGLTIEGREPIAAGTALTPPARGQITSSIADGEFTRALAYLHRSGWEPGQTIQIEGRPATVHELPW